MACATQAGQIGDPLYEKNFLNSSIWHHYNWTYATSFSVPKGTKRMQLVFDGIKMGAVVALDGEILGD